MQAAGETDADTCAYNDFALIKLDPADYGKVNPSVPTLGGPTAPRRDHGALDDVYSYGNSSLRQGITLLSPKLGKSLGASGGGWTHLVYTVSPGIPGDSGSGFMDAQGRAFGVLSDAPARPGRRPPTASRTCARCSRTCAPTAARTSRSPPAPSRSRARSSVEREVAGLTARRRGKYAPMRVASRAAAQPMFTSQSLRAVAKPGSLAFREHRLDDVVHQIDVQGALSESGELGRRIESALAGGVRWLILDLAEAFDVTDPVLAALVEAAAALRARKGELIVAGAPPSVAQRLGAYDVAHRPAVAANVDQAVMILKMLRPKTDIRRAAAARQAADLLAHAAADRAAHGRLVAHPRLPSGARALRVHHRPAGPDSPSTSSTSWAWSASSC